MLLDPQPLFGLPRWLSVIFAVALAFTVGDLGGKIARSIRDNHRAKTPD